MATPDVAAVGDRKYRQRCSTPAQAPSKMWSSFANACISKKRRAKELRQALGGTMKVQTVSTNQFICSSPNKTLYVVNGAAAEIVICGHECSVDFHVSDDSTKTPEVLVYHPGGTCTRMLRGGKVKGGIIGCRAENRSKRHCRSISLPMRWGRDPDHRVAAAASDIVEPTQIALAARLHGATHQQTNVTSRVLLMAYHTTAEKFVCRTCRRLFDTAAELAAHDKWNIGANPSVVRLYPSGHIANFCPGQPEAWKQDALKHINAGRADEAAKLAPTLVRHGASALLRRKLDALK